MHVQTLKVDQRIVIGDSMEIWPTDVDPDLVRLMAEGEMLGGPEDGLKIRKALDLGINGEMRLGNSLFVTVLDIRGDKCRIAIQAPSHVPVRLKEDEKKG